MADSKQTAPYHDKGIGGRFIAICDAELADYVFDPDPDGGAGDHYLSDFDKAMVQDFYMGLTGGPLSALFLEAQGAVNSHEALVSELDCRVGDLVMLRRAIEEGDPKAELFFRIDDMLRETRAALAAASPVSL